MKSYRFLSLLSVLLVLDIAGLRADAVTPEQATQIASQFFSNKGPRRMQSSARRTSAQSAMTTVAVFDSIDSAGQPYIYAVSAPQQDGFVLVSGDDRFNAVLGYSDGSSYDEQTMPENMRAWMQGYIAEMRYLESKGYRSAPLRSASPKAAISPLLTTKWNQAAPFNNNCPIDNSTQQRSVTGCVATAMAQVINYHIQNHNAPTQIVAAIPGYTTYTRGMYVGGIAAGTKLPAASYLIDDYANNAGTDEQKLAVANLMLYCGVAMNMDYKSTGSGVAGSPAQALKTYFGFDSTTRRAERKNFTYQQWMNIIYDELAAGRPVYHSGATATGGHAFVIDGYDGDGLFHVNWGWGGSCDDYFALSVMNPDDNNNIGASTSNDGYTIDQQVVIGVQIGSGESYTEPVLLTMDTYNVNGQNAVFNGANFTGVTHSWTAALAIIDDDGTINQIGGTVPFNLDYGYYSTEELTVPTNTDLAGQTKRIVPVCRLNEEPQGVWHTGPSPDINYWQAVYDANGVPTLTVHPIHNLSGVISVPSNKFVNETQTIQLQVTNSADEFYGQIYLFAGTTENKGAYVTQLGLISLANSSETVQFEWTPTAAGTYNLWVATSTDGSNVIATGSVTIVNDPSLTGKTLVMTAYSFENTDATSAQIDASGIRSVDVYGDRLKGSVTVKNISNSQFGPLNLGVRIEKYNTSTQQYDSDPVLGYYPNFSLQAGKSVNLGIERTSLETDNTYRIRFLNCSLNPNVELEARYVFHLRTLTNYTISYNLLGGSVSEANPTSYNVLSNAIRLNNPTRTGYTFAGWTGTDLDHPTMTVTIPKGSTGNRSYTATWTPNIYVITWQMDDGSLIDTTHVAYDRMPTHSAPVKPNTDEYRYDFAGWSPTPAAATGNAIYTATFTATPYATITQAPEAIANLVYDGTAQTLITAGIANGGTMQYKLGDGAWSTSLPAATDPGRYTICYRAQADASHADREGGSLTAYINYRIDYELEGGSATNPNGYNEDTETFTLTNPTRAGYSFAGWTGTGLSEATKNVTITQGSSGHRSYTATWNLLQLETDGQGNYLIGSKTDWETFCNQVNLDHFSYTGKTIKMTADVGTTLDPVTTMAGDPMAYPKYSFQGTFDGQGHTLTIYYEVTAGYTAPFRVTENATIRNLHVTGSIITSNQMATGFVSQANGTLTIENCRSSVDILSSFEWSGQHAGFVSYIPMMFGEVSCEVTITGCLFDGSIRTTSTTTSCGGFIAVAGGTATIRHSLMAPTSVSEGMVANTFAYYGEHLNIDSCYYYGLHVANNQGTAVHRIRVDEDLAINGIAGETAAYDVSGIHISPTGIQAGNTCYAVPDAELSLSLSSTDPSQAVALYVASAGTILAQDANHVTLTMPNSDVDIHAVLALVSAVTWDKTNALRATDAGGICDVTAGQQKTYAGITIAVSGNGYLQADNGNYKLHCENTNDIIFRTDLGHIQRIEVSCSYGGGLEGWTFEQGRAYWTGDANEVVLSGFGTINGITQIVFYVREPVAPASVTTAPTAKTLHYTGAAQELVTAGVAENGTMQYRVGTNGEWNESVPTATEIDVYEVYYRAKGDAYHPDGEIVGPLVVLLTPALKDTTITITWTMDDVLRMPDSVPGDRGIGYVVDNGLEGFGPKTRDNITVIPFWPGNLSPEVKGPPSPPDPIGPYLISTMNSGKLYFATTLGKFTRIEVGPINTLFTPGLSNWTGWVQYDNMVIWTGNADTVKLIGDGTIREFDKIVFVIENQEVPGIPASVTTAPADKGLTYNGAAQELVTAGVAKGGTMQYRLGTDGEWDEAIPTGTDAGEYAIYYRVVADTNHIDSEIAGPMVVSIAKAPLTVTAEDKVVVLGDEAPVYTATFDEWLGGDDESVLTGSLSFACAYSAGNQPGAYAITPSGVEAANYSLTFQPGSLIVKDVSLQPIGATFNINGNQVRFAAGNLQYNMTNGTWRFADHQWTIIGAAEGNTSDSGWRDLLDWSAAQSTPFVGWRILSEVECRALIDNRASQLSASATVHSQAGLILLPDGMTNPPVELNTSATDYTTNSISDENWATLENAGVIFLPVAGYRDGNNSVSYSLTNGYYWSSSSMASDAAQAYYTRIASSYVHGAEYADKSSGYSVRMVTPALPAATLSSAPQAIDGLVYTGAPQTLVTAGQAENGVIAYRIGEDGRWSTAIPSATNTGTYFVYYRVIGDTEHSDGEELTVGAVTISYTIPTGIDQTTDNPLPVTEKVLIDDQIYILRGGKIYTLQGLEVK